MRKVLALKYRPKNFDELIGQKSVSQTLSMALKSDKLSHAYLFSGLRGSGKTSTARIFAKALVCEHFPNSPCNKCQNCINANEQRHLDIIEMDGASNRKIDDIRDLIEQTRYQPSTAKFKIFIIDEVHMLTKEAFNALLKTLEEPPSFVKFILATTDPLKLPATILSRTQHFRFKKISQTDTINHLKHILNLEKINFEEEALEILARSSNGSLRDALTLLDKAIVYSKESLDTKSIVDMLGVLDPKQISQYFDLILAKDTKAATKFALDLEDQEGEIVLDEIMFFLKTKLFKNDEHFSPIILERFLRIVSNAKELLFIGSDWGFVFVLTSLKFIEALKLKDIRQEIEKLEKEVNTNTQIIQTQNTQNLQPSKNTQSAQTTPTKMPSSSKTKLDLFIDALYKRDIDLGECFERSVKLISFDETSLVWDSKPNPKDKELLTKYSPVIKETIALIFNKDTKVKQVSVTQEPTPDLKQDLTPNPTQDLKVSQQDLQVSQDLKTQDPTQDLTKNQAYPNDTEYLKTLEPTQDTQMSQTQELPLSDQEILDHPFVKQAIKQFEATDIKIQ